MTTNGYTRQSAADIITGLTVEAAPINLEFDTLQDAMDATVGHNHDGTTGGGKKIHLANSIDTASKLPLAYGGSNADLSMAPAGSAVIMNPAGTAFSYLKNNLTAIIAPTVSDDSSLTYSAGSTWLDTVAGIVYICVSPAVGAALWINITSLSSVAPYLGKVLISLADTTPAVLNTSVTVTAPLTKTIVNPGADETLNFVVTTGTSGATGVLQLATSGEAVTGTDTAKAVTAAGVLASILANIDQGQTALYTKIFGMK